MKLFVAVVMFVSVSITFAADVAWQIAPPFSLMPGGSGQESGQAPKNHMADDDKEKAQAQNSQQHARNVALVKTEPETKRDQTANQQAKGDVHPNEKANGSGETLWLIFWVVVTVCTPIGILIAFLSYKQTKRANDLTEQHRMNTLLSEQTRERAYLVVERWELLHDYEKESLSLVCALLNNGRTQPKWIKYVLRTDVWKELPPLPDYQHLPMVDLEYRSIGAGVRVPLYAPFPLVPGFSPTQLLGEINKGRLTLYFYGCVAYADVFNIPHQVAFCARYDPRQMGFTLVSDRTRSYSI